MTLAHPTRSRPVSLKAMLACAASFQEVGVSFFDEIAKIQEDRSDKDGTPAIGALVTSAANLAFALELYLKALRKRLGLPSIATHDLWKLYRELPADTKSRIEAHYDHVRSTIPHQLRAITIAKGPLQRPDWEKLDRKSEALEPVLKRSRDAFSSWRYIFELAIPDRST